MTEAPIQPYRRAGYASLAVLGLTAVHHVEGGIIYHTPWRFHVAVVAPLVAVAIVRALYLAGSRRHAASGLRWSRIAAALIFVIPVAAIGLIEGGYNHLIKNLLYFCLGAREARLLFPPPVYEMPQDPFFEGSGIAQFPLGLVAAYFAWAMLRAPRFPHSAKR